VIPSCVLDASAVLAWLFDERGASTVEKVLDVSALSTINLAEVLYRCDEEGMRTESLERDLRGLGVRIESFTAEDAQIIQEVRRVVRREGARLSLADCCCLATGIRLNVPVVGGDRAWECLRLGIDVRPFR
jgi:PIN domain nuclease of toxin-antitoxin system